MRGNMPILTTTLPAYAGVTDLTGLAKVSMAHVRRRNLVIERVQCRRLFSSGAIQQTQNRDYTACRTTKIHLLATLAAEEPSQRLSAVCISIRKLLQRTIPIRDLHFLLFDDQIACHIAASHLSAIGTVAEVSAWSREQLFVLDGHCDTATETITSNALGKLIGMVLVGIAFERRHDRRAMETPGAGSGSSIARRPIASSGKDLPVKLDSSRQGGL